MEGICEADRLVCIEITHKPSALHGAHVAATLFCKECASLGNVIPPPKVNIPEGI